MQAARTLVLVAVSAFALRWFVGTLTLFHFTNALPILLPPDDPRVATARAAKRRLLLALLAYALLLLGGVTFLYLRFKPGSPVGKG